MVLDRARGRAQGLLETIASPLRNVSPDLMTAISFVLAVIAAVSILLSSVNRSVLLLAAFVLVAASGFLDALDGAVARTRGKTSQRGDFLDHVLDRYSDIALVLGFTFSIFTTSVIVGVLALVGVFMTSYMGTQAQAVGLKRNYGGMLGRADRLVLMLAALLIQFLLVTPSAGVHGPEFLTLTTFDWLLLVFALLGNITAVYRAVVSWRRI